MTYYQKPLDDLMNMTISKTSETDGTEFYNNRYSKTTVIPNAIETAEMNVYKNRLRYLEKMCKKVNLSWPLIQKVESKIPTQFIVDKSDNLIWVKTEKCGSTSWMNVFKSLLKKKKDLKSFSVGVPISSKKIGHITWKSYLLGTISI